MRSKIIRTVAPPADRLSQRDTSADSTQATRERCSSFDRSSGPIAWPSLLMCYRHNCDLSLFGSIEDTEGKPLKSELACAVIGKRVGVWSVPNPGYGVINSLKQMRKRLV